MKWAPAVNPKPLSENVKRGVKWLVEHQLKSGAWGQGEESAQMGGGAELKDVPSVADTCMAALALIRAGNTPPKGEYAKNVLDAVKFVCGEIEESDKDSLYVTPARGTRVQSKLGPYIDTFMAAMLLPEVKDQMPDEQGNKRVAAALDKVLAKIQKNQRQDGTWGGQGWATTIQQGMAVKGLNRAAQYGATVDEKVRARAEDQARRSFDKSSGKFNEEGSAGVQLYTAGANLGSVAESVKTNKQQQARLEQQTGRSRHARRRQGGGPGDPRSLQGGGEGPGRRPNGGHRQARRQAVHRRLRLQRRRGVPELHEHRREPGRQGRRRLEGMGQVDQPRTSTACRTTTAVGRATTASPAGPSAPRRPCWCSWSIARRCRFPRR